MAVHLCKSVTDVEKEFLAVKLHTNKGRYDLKWTQSKEDMKAEIKLVNLPTIKKSDIMNDLKSLWKDKGFMIFLVYNSNILNNENYLSKDDFKDFNEFLVETDPNLEPLKGNRVQYQDVKPKRKKSEIDSGDIILRCYVCKIYKRNYFE